MKRFLLSLALLSSLTACGGTKATYNVSTNVDDPSKQDILLLAATRVIERRMASIGEEVIDLDLQKNSEQPTITVAVKQQAALDLLTQEITQPFDLKIMKEVPAEEAEISVEGHGGFASTGITGEHILWLQAAEEPGGKGRVTISFTDEGRELMKKVFKENVGKNIGLFVRNQLVSKLLVDTDELKDDIIITDIPSATLANVFADDVNVGLHVTFTLQE